MKKKLLGLSLLLATFGFGLAVSTQQPIVAFAKGEEDATSEVVEQQVEEETTDLSEELSQTAKDCIAFVRDFLSQPLVIGGVSTTIGALAILIISKAIGGISKKKLLGLKDEVENVSSKLLESASKKDFESVKEQSNQLAEILKEIVPTIKNIKVKENCIALLEDLEPVKDEIVDYGVKEKDKVVADTKVETEVVAKQISDILKKD